MTVALDATARATQPVPARPAADERVDPADALEDIIAAHRTALLELAPHQAWRSVREDTGWHMAELGLLLCHRDAQRHTQNPAPGGVPDPERGLRCESNGTTRSRT